MLCLYIPAAHAAQYYKLYSSAMPKTYCALVGAAMGPQPWFSSVPCPEGCQLGRPPASTRMLLCRVGHHVSIWQRLLSSRPIHSELGPCFVSSGTPPTSTTSPCNKKACVSVLVLQLLQLCACSMHHQRPEVSSGDRRWCSPRRVQRLTAVLPVSQHLLPRGFVLFLCLVQR